MEWAIRNKQPWPLIQRIEGVSYEEYRATKLRLREKRRTSERTSP